MSGVWAWLKQHWRWVVFPVGVLGSVLGWFLWWRGSDNEATSTTTDEAADRAVEAISKASVFRAASIEAMEKRHGHKLSSMSAEQQKEFEEVKKGPVTEVARWIDKL